VARYSASVKSGVVDSIPPSTATRSPRFMCAAIRFSFVVLVRDCPLDTTDEAAKSGNQALLYERGQIE